MSRQPIVYISRTETFSACHRMHSKQLTDEENVQTYGKCNHVHGHGHNYKMEVILRGPVDPITGMVMDLGELKHVINESIMSVLDHRNIDVDVPYFLDIVSTAENIVVFIWKTLMENLPAGLLYEIRLQETENNVVRYRGELS